MALLRDCLTRHSSKPVKFPQGWATLEEISYPVVSESPRSPPQPAKRGGEGGYLGMVSLSGQPCG